jgi:hypothetical protein
MHIAHNHLRQLESGFNGSSSFLIWDATVFSILKEQPLKGRVRHCQWNDRNSPESK